MPPKSTGETISMIDQIAAAIAEAEGGDVVANHIRYRRLALAALKTLERPTKMMIDAAHESVWFDAEWAINSRADFQKAVRAMIVAAIEEGRDAG